MNRMAENYLRCYCSYHQNDWDELLSAAEFAYSFSLSDNLAVWPFEADHRCSPYSALSLISGSKTPVASVDEMKLEVEIVSWGCSVLVQIVYGSSSGRGFFAV